MKVVELLYLPKRKHREGSWKLVRSYSPPSKMYRKSNINDAKLFFQMTVTVMILPCLKSQLKIMISIVVSVDNNRILIYFDLFKRYR